MAHKDLGVKHSKHRPGCVSSHESCYIEGNTCSYRWHAAKRARSDSRIQYRAATESKAAAWPRTQENLTKLNAWVKAGKVSTVIPRKGKLGFTVEPFATGWAPWNNHVHHIIPRSVLVGVLEEIAKKADPHEHRMFEVMIHGLLGEPYNVNDEPNVMILPVLDRDAVEMGLPRHLEGKGSGAVDHPDYSRAVSKQVRSKLKPKYVALCTAIKTQKHRRTGETPVVRPVLEAISHTTYESILSQTAKHRRAGASNVTLDSIAPTLFR